MSSILVRGKVPVILSLRIIVSTYQVIFHTLENYLEYVMPLMYKMYRGTSFAYLANILLVRCFRYYGS